MRGWTSSIGGALLVGMAMWMLVQGNSGKIVLVLAGGALVLFFRGYQGLTITEAADDAVLGASFVADPKRTAMNVAFNRVHQIFDDDSEGEDGHPIDVEKIMDRYLAERSRNPPLPEGAPAPAQSGFGRKGL
jgi:hypothetical protein